LDTRDARPPLNAKPAEPSPLIRILVVALQPVACHGLSALVGAQSDFLVVGNASNTKASLQLAREHRAEVLLVDSSVLGCLGPHLIRELITDSPVPSYRIIVLTDPLENADIVRLFRSGAHGVVLKESPVDVIFKCIRKVHAGEAWIGRSVMADVVEALASSRDSDECGRTSDLRLTPREAEVLKLLVEGETNKSIAERLSVCEYTVKHHLTNIFDKTGASNRLELALFSIHHGWTSSAHTSQLKNGRQKNSGGRT
jgi:two-component system, NarL family, nitrate/nitrite response regulator NarL